MPRRPLALLAPFAALALLLAGCGDDDDGADETTTTTEAGDAAGDDEAAPDDGDTSTTGDDGTTTEPDDGATTVPGGDAEGFCATFEDIGEQFGTIDDSDLDSLREGVRETAAQMDDLVEQAPDELRDDLELLAGAFQDIADEADAAESVEEFEAAAEPIFSEPEYDAAGDRVSAWTDENCEGSGGEDGGGEG